MDTRPCHKSGNDEDQFRMEAKRSGWQCKNNYTVHRHMSWVGMGWDCSVKGVEESDLTDMFDKNLCTASSSTVTKILNLKLLFRENERMHGCKVEFYSNSACSHDKQPNVRYVLV